MSNTDRRLRLAAVGDNCVDRLRPSGRRLIGGNAVNVAVQWARLGAQAAYFGAVGADEDGALTARVLAANGVDLRHLARRPGNTAFTDIDVGADGDRRIAFEDFGACAGYAPDAPAFDALLLADHVHIGWLDDGGETRRRLAAAGRSVSQDISVNAAPENLGVEGLAIAFVSGEGSHEDAAALARLARERGARDVVVTRGGAGSSLFFGAASIEIAARPVRALDTTGAGDSYIAAFLHACLSGESPEAAGGRASDFAAATCLHEGGFPQG